MVVETELYDLLGVNPSASQPEIRKAYRKQNPNDPNASDKFQAISNAYEILSDPSSRESYDMFGDSSSARNMNDGPPMDEFFNSFFFDMNRPPPPPKVRDQIVDFEVSLEDLYNGKSVHFAIEKEAICKSCTGTGGRHGAKPSTCSRCSGQGTILISRQLGPSLIGQMPSPCPDCRGEGVKIKDKYRCKKCTGKKTLPTKKKISFEIKKGMVDGHKIRLQGEGDEQPGMKPSSLIFKLKAQQHPTFKLRGYDLSITVKLTLLEALIGFDKIIVNHLDGHGVRLCVPKGRVIQPGETLVLRDQGMPLSKGYGDLYVKCEVDMPSGYWMKLADTSLLEKSLPNPDPRSEIKGDDHTQTPNYESSSMSNFGNTHANPNDFDDDNGPSFNQCTTQ